MYGNAGGPGVAYGVKGVAGGGNTFSRAGYFQGSLEYTGNLIGPSDENLKENITELNEALATLGQLRPKRFNFRFSEPELVHMNFPHGQQMGLIAQELEQVLPELVHDSHLSADFDSDGGSTGPAIDYKSVDYISLIPLLIGAINELKAQVDACCSAAGRSILPAGPAAPVETLRTERLSIDPNPFTTSTTLRYYVAQAGRARLELSSADGRSLEVLREERTMEGEYSYVWNTSGLAPGTYFVALVVDGNVVVKRAVKVGER